MAAALRPATRRRAGGRALRDALRPDVPVLSVRIRSALRAARRRPGADGPRHPRGDCRRRRGVRPAARRRAVQVALGRPPPPAAAPRALPADAARPVVAPADTPRAHGARRRTGHGRTSGPTPLISTPGRPSMWFRRLVKTGLATLMYRTGTDRLIGRLQSDPGVPLVLGYHRVVDDFRTAAARTIPAMLISRKMLERHLEWL